MKPSFLPTINLPPRLYWFVAGFIAVAFAGTLGGCFGLVFTGHEVPQFALDQLKWMGLCMGAILSVPHSGATSPDASPATDDLSTSDAPSGA